MSATATHRIGFFLLLAAMCLAVLGSKFRLIDRYGSDLPYWDQWDGQADAIYRPHFQGTLAAADFFQFHNEHRIALTRLFTFGLLELNDEQWDTRLEMVANACLHLAAAVLLFSLAWRAFPAFTAILLTGAIALFFSHPVSMDNTLGGFQSQFYFMTLAALLNIGGGFLSRPWSLPWWLSPLGGLLGVFSMASGLLSAATVVLVLGLAALRDRRLDRPAACLAAMNGIVVVLGLVLMSGAPQNEDMRPSGLIGFLASVWDQLAWPMGGPWAAVLAVLPPVAFALAWFRNRLEGRIAPALVGLALWSGLQVGAIAYGRGGFEVGGQYSSRYTDLYSIGVLVNLFIFAAVLAQVQAPGLRRLWLAGLTLFLVSAIWGLSAASANARTQLADLPGINAARNLSVRNYLTTRDPVFFTRQPWAELPYPTPQRLAKMLDDPGIRRILPPSVRPSPAHADWARDARLAPHSPLAAGLSVPRGLPVWNLVPPRASPVRFLSEPFQPEHSLVILYVAGPAGADQVKLNLVDEQGLPHPALDSNYLPSATWKRVNFRVPAGPLRLEIEAQAGADFAFSEPFATTRLSDLAERTARQGSTLLAWAAVCALAGLALLWPRLAGGDAESKHPISK
jgi:hypothetical protein